MRTDDAIFPIIRPYARQEDYNLLKNVTSVKILQGNTTILPACQYIHVVPVVIFSTSDFVGNVFHELSHVQFILEDYEASFVRKYSKPMSLLSAYEVINPAANQSVHCFPGAIIGLKFHGHLSLNFSDSPGGHSMQDFKQFLRQAYNLKFAHVSEIRRPNLKPEDS